jgi:hypothetical protein
MGGLLEGDRGGNAVTEKLFSDDDGSTSLSSVVGVGVEIASGSADPSVV